MAIALGTSPFEVCKLIYGLVTSGLLGLKENLEQLRTDRLRQMTAEQLREVVERIHEHESVRRGRHFATTDGFFRYDHDAEPIGSTRWLIVTGGYGFTASDLPFSARPFVEATWHRVSADEGDARLGQTRLQQRLPDAIAMAASPRVQQR